MKFNQEVNFDFFSKGIDQGTLRILYYQYKAQIISAVIVLICALLFLFLIIPQIQNVVSIRAQEEEHRKKIAILKDNIAFLKRLDDTTLSSQTQLVSKALPAEKDFIAILSTLSRVADSANVSLGDFSVTIGDITPNVSQTTGKKPSVEISLNIRGDKNAIEHFLSSLAQQMPVSEVINMSGGSRDTSLLIDFYFRPLPSITFHDDARISTQSKEESELLETLKTWGGAKLNSSFDTTSKSGTASGKINSGPFAK